MLKRDLSVIWDREKNLVLKIGKLQLLKPVRFSKKLLEENNTFNCIERMGIEVALKDLCEECLSKPKSGSCKSIDSSFVNCNPPGCKDFVSKFEPKKLTAEAFIVGKKRDIESSYLEKIKQDFSEVATLAERIIAINCNLQNLKSEVARFKVIMSPDDYNTITEIEPSEFSLLGALLQSQKDALSARILNKLDDINSSQYMARYHD